MKRTLFVYIIILVMGKFALAAPFGALCFYLWLAYFRPEDWMHDPTIINTLDLHFTAGVYLVLRALKKFREPKIDLRLFLLLMFVALTGVSAYTTTAPAYLAWDRWIEFAKLIAIGYLAYAFTSTDLARFRIVLLVIAFSLGFEAVKQGWTTLLLKPGATNNNPLPQLGDNNGVAVGLLMLVPIVGALSRTATGEIFFRFNKSPKWAKLERRVHQFTLIGIVYRAISTYSRGAFLAGGAMTIVYVLRSKQKLKAGFGALVVIVVIGNVLPQAFWYRMSTINAPIAETPTKDASAEQMSSESRVHFWAVAIEMANANPLTGVGYNSYNYWYNTYDFSRGFYGRGKSVHSIWFGILAELGYPGLLLFTLMFILALMGMFTVTRLAKKGLIPMEFHHYAIGFQTSLTACIVGGAFVPFQYTEMLWHFLTLTFALRTLALHTAAAPATVEAPVQPEREHVLTGFRPRAAAMRRDGARA